MLAFELGFRKCAWLMPADVESAMQETYAPKAHARGLSAPLSTPEQESALSNLLAAEKAKSFALRHPILSGIPTLGIWPSTAHDSAIEAVARQAAQTDPSYIQALKDQETEVIAKQLAARQRREEMDRVEHERSKELLPLRMEQEKSERYGRLADIGSGAAVSLADILARRQRANDEDSRSSFSTW